METIKTEYLGDGVYAEKNKSGILLGANNHMNPTDQIFLEWQVLENLIKFAKGNNNGNV